MDEVLERIVEHENAVVILSLLMVIMALGVAFIALRRRSEDKTDDNLRSMIDVHAATLQTISASLAEVTKLVNQTVHIQQQMWNEILQMRKQRELLQERIDETSELATARHQEVIGRLALSEKAATSRHEAMAGALHTHRQALDLIPKSLQGISREMATISATLSCIQKTQMDINKVLTEVNATIQGLVVRVERLGTDIDKAVNEAPPQPSPNMGRKPDGGGMEKHESSEATVAAEEVHGGEVEVAPPQPSPNMGRELEPVVPKKPVIG